MRRSRALPYKLHVNACAQAEKGKAVLTFENTGKVGAVFHVYDRLELGRIPRRYTVEVGKALSGEWLVDAEQGRYDLWVYGPNGFVREFRGRLRTHVAAAPEIEVRYDSINSALEVIATNAGSQPATLVVKANAYRGDGPWTMHVLPGSRISQRWFLLASHRWYDFTVGGEDWERRIAGRMEDGKPGFSDPAI